MIKNLFKFAALIIAIPFIRGKKHGPPRPQEPRSASSQADPGSVRRWLLTAGAVLGALAMGGLLVVVSGAVPIKASSRHWAITSWFLNFAKERSVATHTLGKDAPPLDSPLLRLKGATHYETGCRPCHGSPDTAQPRVPHGMTPPPPPLRHIRSKFDENELFYIVKHGIKFTGMPAWPAAHRDDEVWAVVAFLQALPGLNSDTYQRLAIGEGEATERAPIRGLLLSENTSRTLVESCSRCHGTDGLGRGLGASPKLAGQKPDYLLGSLQAYASGNRGSGIMEPIASALGPEAMRQLAAYYSQLPAGPHSSQVLDEASVERGRAIATNGLPGQQVPACMECHGPDGEPRNPTYPRLTGQYPEYLLLQLELFAKKMRGGTSYAHLMHFVADRLTPQQRSDVANYFASLPNSTTSPDAP